MHQVAPQKGETLLDPSRDLTYLGLGLHVSNVVQFNHTNPLTFSAPLWGPVEFKYYFFPFCFGLFNA